MAGLKLYKLLNSWNIPAQGFQQYGLVRRETWTSCRTLVEGVKECFQSTTWYPQGRKQQGLALADVHIPGGPGQRGGVWECSQTWVRLESWLHHFLAVTMSRDHCYLKGLLWIFSNNVFYIPCFTKGRCSIHSSYSFLLWSLRVSYEVQDASHTRQVDKPQQQESGAVFRKKFRQMRAGESVWTQPMHGYDRQEL